MAKDDIDQVPTLVGKFTKSCIGESYPTIILAAITLAEYCAEKMLEDSSKCKEPQELYDAALIAAAKLSAARTLRDNGYKPTLDTHLFVFRGENKN